MKTLLALLCSAAIFAASGEVASRAYWAYRGLSFANAQRELHLFYYPRLRPVEALRIDPDDGFYDVLLLGGSVLMPAYGQIGASLGRRLGRATGQPTRIHNVAFEGHSSLDSLYKYRHLRDKHFDLVVLYHGINEVRANNAPPTLFRDDYSHYSWYDAVNRIEAGADSRYLVFPVTLRLLAQLAGERLGLRAYVPTHEPRPEWIQYAATVQTRGSFEHNLQGVMRLAAEKHEPLALMTFAYYQPEQYPDVPDWLFPTEGWGKPEYVVRGIEAHNEIVRTLARGADLILVDQEARIPKDASHFRDICHLTPAGTRSWVDNLLAARRAHLTGMTRAQ